jgi:CheY-like chemotaxis protein
MLQRGTVMAISLNVLVAIEDPALSGMLGDRLAARGHVTEQVADGICALQAASRGCFDVAILEIALGGLTGWEVGARLHMDRQHRRLRLVAISSEPNALDLVRSRRSGFHLHVGKEDWMDRLPAMLHGGTHQPPARPFAIFAVAA